MPYKYVDLISYSAKSNQKAFFECFDTCIVYANCCLLLLLLLFYLPIATIYGTLPQQLSICIITLCRLHKCVQCHSCGCGVPAEQEIQTIQQLAHQKIRIEHKLSSVMVM